VVKGLSRSQARDVGRKRAAVGYQRQPNRNKRKSNDEAERTYVTGRLYLRGV
jgi:hypothetical protein